MVPHTKINTEANKAVTGVNYDNSAVILLRAYNTNIKINGYTFVFCYTIDDALSTDTLDKMSSLAWLLSFGKCST